MSNESPEVIDISASTADDFINMAINLEIHKSLRDESLVLDTGFEIYAGEYAIKYLRWRGMFELTSRIAELLDAAP